MIAAKRSLKNLATPRHRTSRPIPPSIEPVAAMTTLVDALSRMNVDQLKPLVAWLGEVSPKGRKDELIGGIMRSLSAGGLRLLWSGLDDLQRLAVAEALHAVDGVFHSDQFQAKHGRLPAFTTEAEARPGTRSGSPTRLALFLFPYDRSYCVPIDLRPALRAFVPEPEPALIATAETLPSTFGDAALTVRPTERDALVDLPVMLRLAEQGRIQVGDKTSLPTAPTLRLLTEKLAGGDFYGDEPPNNGWDQRIGPIKAFAWPMLLQAAGLVQRKGGKLTLSKTGLKAVGSAPTGVLRSIWQKWLASDLLDEFSRIDTVKGQRAKGRVMTAAAPRRDAICEALDLCPVGAWIAVDEFSRFMLASDHAFDVRTTRGSSTSATRSTAAWAMQASTIGRSCSFATCCASCSSTPRRWVSLTSPTSRLATRAATFITCGASMIFNSSAATTAWPPCASPRWAHTALDRARTTRAPRSRARSGSRCCRACR